MAAPSPHAAPMPFANDPEECNFHVLFHFTLFEFFSVVKLKSKNKQCFGIRVCVDIKLMMIANAGAQLKFLILKCS